MSSDIVLPKNNLFFVILRTAAHSRNQHTPGPVRDGPITRRVYYTCTHNDVTLFRNTVKYTAGVLFK